MGCNSQISTLEYLEDEGIIKGEDNTLVNKSMLIAETNNLVKVAEDVYGILGKEPFKIRNSKVIPNLEFFKDIDTFNDKMSEDSLDVFTYQREEEKEEVELDKENLNKEQQQKFIEKGNKEELLEKKEERRKLQDRRYLGINSETAAIDKQILLLHDALSIVIENDTSAYFKGKAIKAKEEIGEEIFQKRNKDIPKKINRLNNLNYFKSALVFYNFLSNQSTIINNVLEERLGEPNGDLDKKMKLYRDIKTYSTSFDIIKDVQDLIVNLYHNNKEDKIINEEQFQELSESFKTIVVKTASIESLLSNLEKDILVETLGTTTYFDKVDIEMRTASEIRANTLFPKGKEGWKENRAEYVRKFMIENRETVIKRTKEEFRKLLENPTYDISNITGGYLSDSSINNPFIQIAKQIVMEAEVKYKNEIQAQLIELNALQKEHKMNKSNWRNITETDGNGVTYLKGEYKAEYRSEVLRLQKNVENATTTLKKVKAREALKAFYEKNTTLSARKRIIPNAKWKNDLSTLTEAEEIFRQKFMGIGKDSHNKMNKKMSLYRTEKDFKRKHEAIQFHLVPKQLETNYSKFMRMDLLGGIRKTYEALTVKEIDDVEEALSVKRIEQSGKIRFLNPNDDIFNQNVERTHQDLAGKDLNSLNINYRNEVYDNQNIDLLTVYAKEIENAEKYVANKNIEEIALILADHVKGAKFYKTKGLSKRLSLSWGKDEALKKYEEIEGENSEVYKKLVSMYENNIYEITSKYAGNIGSTDINRLTSSFIAYSSYLGMALKIPGAVNNFFLGTVQNFVEQAGGEFTTLKDSRVANTLYMKNFGGILGDIGRPVKTNFVNQLMSIFDTGGDYSQLNNQFERNNRAKQLAESSSLFALYSMGEHEMQGTLFLSIMEGTKVLNEKGKFINKKGEVVDSIKKAASLLDMYYKDPKDGLVKTKDIFSYTTRDYINKYKEGGEVSIKTLVKDRIFRAHGIYDTKRQSDFQRNWYGKLFLHYKKYFEPALLNRFRGLSHVGNPITGDIKKVSNLKDFQKYFNYSTSTEEYGYFTTFLRELFNSIKKHKLDVIGHIQEARIKNKPLSNHQLANLRKANTELGIITAMVTLAYTFASAAADDDDNDLLWAASYFSRRQYNELTQYFMPTEMIRITKNPIASIPQLNTLVKMVGIIIPPYGDTYATGDNAGQYKDFITVKRATLPKSFAVGYDINYKKMYNFFDSLD